MLYDHCVAGISAIHHFLFSSHLFHSFVSLFYLIGFFLFLTTIAMEGRKYNKIKRSTLCYSKEQDKFVFLCRKATIKDFISVYFLSFIFAALWNFFSLVSLIKSQKDKENSDNNEALHELNKTISEIKCLLQKELGNDLIYKFKYIDEVKRITDENSIPII